MCRGASPIPRRVVRAWTGRGAARVGPSRFDLGTPTPASRSEPLPPDQPGGSRLLDELSASFGPAPVSGDRHRRRRPAIGETARPAEQATCRKSSEGPEAGDGIRRGWRTPFQDVSGIAQRRARYPSSSVTSRRSSGAHSGPGARRACQELGGSRRNGWSRGRESNPRPTDYDCLQVLTAATIRRQCARG